MKAPIFVIGMSRSGTSLLSTLISRHPMVKGIFPRQKNNNLRLRPDGTTHGYAETRHIWKELEARVGKMELEKGIHWSHPKYISYVYQEDIDNDLCIKLRAELESQIKTDHIPLIKKPPYTLKIGVLNKLYPNAKYVFIIRNRDNWLVGVKNRITNNHGVSYFDKSKLELCWYITNKTALHDLIYYAPDQHIITKCELIQNKETAKIELGKIFEFIGIEQVDIDLNIINDKYNHGLHNKIADMKLLDEI